MGIPKIHEGEYRFCLILWKHEPAAGEALSGATGLEADDDLHHHQAAGRARDPEKQERARHRAGLPG